MDGPTWYLTWPGMELRIAALAKAKGVRRGARRSAYLPTVAGENQEGGARKRVAKQDDQVCRPGPVACIACEAKLFCPLADFVCPSAQELHRRFRRVAGSRCYLRYSRQVLHQRMTFSQLGIAV
jgi:hypothetical protein